MKGRVVEYVAQREYLGDRETSPRWLDLHPSGTMGEAAQARAMARQAYEAGPSRFETGRFRIIKRSIEITEEVVEWAS